jgi:hypothetical protein
MVDKLGDCRAKRIMTWKLSDRLLRREIGGTRRFCQIKGLYGDSQWVDDLDIVNELSGHSGCVNALRSANSPIFIAFANIPKVGHDPVDFSLLVQTIQLSTSIHTFPKTRPLNSI